MSHNGGKAAAFIRIDPAQVTGLAAALEDLFDTAELLPLVDDDAELAWLATDEFEEDYIPTKVLRRPLSLGGAGHTAERASVLTLVPSK